MTTFSCLREAYIRHSFNHVLGLCTAPLTAPGSCQTGYAAAVICNSPVAASAGYSCLCRVLGRPALAKFPQDVELAAHTGNPFAPQRTAAADASQGGWATHWEPNPATTTTAAAPADPWDYVAQQAELWAPRQPGALDNPFEHLAEAREEPVWPDLANAEPPAWQRPSAWQDMTANDALLAQAMQEELDLEVCYLS